MASSCRLTAKTSSFNLLSPRLLTSLLVNLCLSLTLLISFETQLLCFLPHPLFPLKTLCVLLVSSDFLLLEEASLFFSTLLDAQNVAQRDLIFLVILCKPDPTFGC